jgi:DNA-binding response OmpR family regulator
MIQKRILVVEDDSSIRLLEKRILETAGYAVDCAASGEAALELLSANRYTAVVADVMMPGMDGFDLTREIRNRFQKNLPVLLVTAVPDALKAAHQKDAKPLSVIQKPFAPNALVTAVRLLESQVEKPSEKPLEKREKSTPNAPKDPPKKKSWFDKLIHPSDN